MFTARCTTRTEQNLGLTINEQGKRLYDISVYIAARFAIDIRIGQIGFAFNGVVNKCNKSDNCRILRADPRKEFAGA